MSISQHGLRRRMAGGLVALLMGSGAAAEIINGGFETNDFTGWTLEGTGFVRELELARDFIPPIAPPWEPREGRYFASLWSTNNDPNAPVRRSMLTQHFDALAGDRLEFDYFFDFGDVEPFYDIAVATLTWSGGKVVLFEHNTPGHRMGPGANIDWTTISHVLPVADRYTLQFETQDAFSDLFESILGVDDVHLVIVPEPATALALPLLLACTRRRR